MSAMTMTTTLIRLTTVISGRTAKGRVPAGKAFYRHAERSVNAQRPGRCQLLLFVRSRNITREEARRVRRARGRRAPRAASTSASAVVYCAW